MGNYPRGKEPLCPECHTEKLHDRNAKRCVRCRQTPGWHGDVVETGPPPSTLFDERWDTFCKWIGRTPALAHRIPAKGKGHDILHLADLHIPHLHEAAFARAVEANKDCQVCVLGGDALNCGAASRFIESSFAHPKDEMAQLTLVLQHLSETFQEVYCNTGNHPDRIRKYFGSRIPPYMMFLVQTNPIEFVIEGLRAERGITNLHIAKPVVSDLESFCWLTILGDVAFAHAETHSKIAMRPAENVGKFLRKWSRRLPSQIRVICQEHNHTGGKRYDDELGCLLIQTPCLSQDVSYQTESRIAYGPNQIGHTRIVRDAHGRADINRSSYWLDTEAMEVAA